MIKRRSIMVFCASILLVCLASGLASAADDINLLDDMAAYNKPEIHINDPLEPLNRVFFQFNDKLYFYLLKPAAKAWSFVVPQALRSSLWSAFRNLMMPVRLVNDLLQGRVSESGIEVSRFVINSTIGVAGLGDPARYVFKLESSDEDLGQTLGVYGAGEGIYICWPFLGPSNIRDTIGMAGDAFLDPLNYVTPGWEGAATLRSVKRVNYTSLNLGEYEQFKDAAFDPYIAMREFYTNVRRKKISNRMCWKCEAKTDNEKLDKTGVIHLLAAKPQQLLAPKDAGRYYVQVGTFFDRDSMNDVDLKLVSMGETTVVATYRRGAYTFYGLQVPAGVNIEDAKRVELKLMLAGFSQTTVLRYSALPI
ncbi:MAG: hypothetical protein GXP59_10640 [Deltaproteobacteria bacterium]|nr:hypothetical protein [Deltaproteobacteria bacterium]